MSDEFGLRIILWLIIFVGSLAITTGCLYASLYLFGRIIKYLGYWKVTMQAVAHIHRERRKK